MDLGRDSAKSASRDAAEKRPVEPAMSKGAASGAAMDPVGGFGGKSGQGGRPGRGRRRCG